MSEEYIDLSRNLIRDCIKGDRQAQYRLYMQYSRSMYNICIRMLVNREDAEDILQEAFIQAFRRLDTFRGESSFGTWLKRIVINRCLDFLKKRKLSFMDSDEEKIPDSQDELLDEEQISPDMIHECIKSLPEGARVVVNLYLMEGFSHKESAKMLGITESTAKTQYHRAKYLLRERINEKLLYEKA